jgi:arginase family enzyme
MAAGATVFSEWQVREMGIEQAAGEALRIAGEGCDSIYLSVDIDSVEHASAPGTGYHSLSGLTGREFLALLRALGRSGKIGAIDLVEVSPRKDPFEMTAVLAGRAIADFLGERLFTSEPLG